MKTCEMTLIPDHTVKINEAGFDYAKGEYNEGNNSSARALTTYLRLYKGYISISVVRVEFYAEEQSHN